MIHSITRQLVTKVIKASRLKSILYNTPYNTWSEIWTLEHKGVKIEVLKTHGWTSHPIFRLSGYDKTGKDVEEAYKLIVKTKLNKQVTKYGPAETAELYSAYTEGFSIADIAKELDVNVTRASYLISTGKYFYKKYLICRSNQYSYHKSTEQINREYTISIIQEILNEGVNNEEQL